MSELAPFEINALAIQYCGLDPARQLTKADREAVAEAERLIQLYLMRTAVDRRYTNQQQADALGVSLATVKRWAASEGYDKIAAFMAPPSRSPMVQEGQAYVQDELLPLALRKARELLESDEVRASTKANLIKEVMKFAFRDKESGAAEEQRRDAMQFLKEQGVQINAHQIVINQQLAPPEYLDKFQAAMGDVVDGEASEVPAIEG